MGFWREAQWQSATADAVEQALREVHARLMVQSLGNSAWTRAVMDAVGGLTAARCPQGICAYKGSQPTQWYSGGEWMFDLAWIVQQAAGPAEYARTIGLPLVLECEWLGWRDVWDDFDKLLVARAGLRVFIFSRDATTPEHAADILLNRARAFVEATESDGWLICEWTRDGFVCSRQIGSPA